MCTDVYGMYMYICEHAYFWDEQKGEGGKTPGCRLTVGRLRVLKPFPTARPSPASPQPSLHPPPPCFGQRTNITNTCMLRSVTLGSTLRCWPHLQRVEGFARAETTRVARSQSPQPCSPVCCVCLSVCTGGNPAAGPHAVHGRARAPACVLHTAAVTCIVARCCSRYGASSSGRSWEPVDASAQIGRASCRERV